MPHTLGANRINIFAKHTSIKTVMIGAKIKSLLAHHRSIYLKYLYDIFHSLGR